MSTELHCAGQLLSKLPRLKPGSGLGRAWLAWGSRSILVAVRFIAKALPFYWGKDLHPVGLRNATGL